MKLLMFPGQGIQKVGMGYDVFSAYQSAKDVFGEVDDALNFKLSNLIFNGGNLELTRTENAQVAIMTASMAYLRAYEEEHGVKLCDENTICAGHSLGEYTALCVAGVLSLADTAKLLRARGTAMQDCSSFSCGMTAILGLNRRAVNDVITQAEKEIERGQVVQVANDNCDGQVVISGHKTALAIATEKAMEAGARRSVPLNVSGAFHSSLMNPAAEKMRAVLENANFQKPTCPIIANFTARDETAEFATLLVSQITGCVRWRESMLTAVRLGVTEALEIGPENVLAGLARRTVPDLKITNINSLDSVKN